MGSNLKCRRSPPYVVLGAGGVRKVRKKKAIPTIPFRLHNCSFNLTGLQFTIIARFMLNHRIGILDLCRNLTIASCQGNGNSDSTSAITINVLCSFLACNRRRSYLPRPTDPSATVLSDSSLDRQPWIVITQANQPLYDLILSTPPHLYLSSRLMLACTIGARGFRFESYAFR